MSEHQYYEFQTIDRPLDAAAQRALRQLSSRATITDRSFVNEYQWGDFRGDPRQLMEKWFDLFVHWASWGSRTVMVRVPRRYLDPKAVAAYALEDTVEPWSAGDFTFVRFNRPNEDPVDDLPPEDLTGALTGIRSEVLRGDTRAFYLGWLVGVSEGMVEEDATEPPCPPGLAELSDSLKTLSAFFGLDEDLIAAAAEGNPDPGVGPVEPSDEALSAFLETLPEQEKTTLLRRAVLESDPHIRLDVARRWAEATGATSPQATVATRTPRTVRQLQAAAEMQAEQRRQRKAKQAAEKRARREQQAQRDLEVRLEKLKPRVEAAWLEADTLAQMKRAKEYDLALALLKDLAHLADREGERAAFDQRLYAFRERHRGMAFLKRLNAAGLVVKRV